MHVLSRMILRGAALTDLVESVADLISFGTCDDPSLHQRVAVCDAGRDVRLEQPAVEAVGVVEFREARIDLPFKSPAPKFLRFRHEIPPGKFDAPPTRMVVYASMQCLCN